MDPDAAKGPARQTPPAPATQPSKGALWAPWPGLSWSWADQAKKADGHFEPSKAAE